ncbi:haloacid dehalogenase superfamily, subfamily IA, variant 1 with third motif having Dx(3-4)D or Dx(3-4)E [Oceanobacillus limi]|uniref:Haloacid dehalogenase superfamily, subfamily IA, variant 1 with third motif having Dx(3-4)D or Dx(3-4)E n=1 Tax=Oceanobacillus limi TaxID=930131 RepID=A0A1I0BK65_9BACI|nr:HAD family hydrolase [Oceanobacillus limi]SET06632.1 haloacid dehalogenase superfamily, subfamily IA, variant 1 with third motif having Dx(3-4)D or Dx(3-4)E [Oceanobacillus limi]
MTKQWITFDLDGTLMQNPFIQWVFPEIVSAFQQELNQDININKIIVAEHELRMKENKVVEAYDWDDIVARTIRKLNLSLKIDVAHLVEKHAVEPKVYLLEQNIINSLEELKRQNYSLAAVTNGYAKYQIPVMKELGLYTLFNEIITPDRCGYAKPDSRILNTLKKDGEIMAHIGDRIDHDVVLANRLGIKSVWINRNLPSPFLEMVPARRGEIKRLDVICKEKWKQENKQDSTQFPNEGFPDFIITSIDELVDLFIE